MTEKIASFTPQHAKNSALNLHEFIAYCKARLNVFGEDLRWDDWRWPGASWTKLGTHANAATSDVRLNDEFADFAKAYFRYQQGISPTQTKNELKALKLIEAALVFRHNDGNIALLDASVLDQAAKMARDHYSDMAAYHAGRELERLSKFVTNHRLVPAHLAGWRTPIKKPRDMRIQTGKEALARHLEKLPPQAALDAMAELFSNDPVDVKDRFTNSAFAMFMCAPSRASEVLELPADLEVEEADSSGVMRYGWRFYSAKGFEGDIKWLPTEFVGIGKAAVGRIKAMTESARALARWIEHNPGKFYRHADCPSVADNFPLTRQQAAAALGLISLDSTGLSAQDGSHTLDSLWQWVLRRQPKDFPWMSKEKRIRFSNALFCMTANMLHTSKGTSPVILWTPDVNVFNNDLGPCEWRKSDSHKSIFDRHGYWMEDGSRIKVTSHQIRHFLNTIANRGNLSQELIAKWSGRADVKQNRVYNHMSEFEMVAATRNLDPSLSLFGPEGAVGGHPPVVVGSLDLVERGPLHVTEFGICVHDYTLSPCERFRDCLNCEEQVCVKGDAERERRIRLRLRQVEVDFDAAKEAVEQGYAGADRWYEHHEKSIVRLRKLIQILDNPDVAAGAQIRLSDGGDFSHLGRAIQDRLTDQGHAVLKQPADHKKRLKHG